jgi:hypothetical protein
MKSGRIKQILDKTREKMDKYFRSAQMCSMTAQKT